MLSKVFLFFVIAVTCFGIAEAKSSCHRQIAKALVASTDVMEALPSRRDRGALLFFLNKLESHPEPSLFEPELRALSLLRSNNPEAFESLQSIFKFPPLVIEEVTQYANRPKPGWRDRTYNVAAIALIFGVYATLNRYHESSRPSAEAVAIVEEMKEIGFNPTDVEVLRPILSKFTMSGSSPREIELSEGLEASRISDSQSRNTWTYLYDVTGADEFDRFEIKIKFDLFTPETFEVRFFEDGSRPKAAKLTGGFNRQ